MTENCELDSKSGASQSLFRTDSKLCDSMHSFALMVKTVPMGWTRERAAIEVRHVCDQIGVTVKRIDFPKNWESGTWWNRAFVHVESMAHPKVVMSFASERKLTYTDGKFVNVLLVDSSKEMLQKEEAMIRGESSEARKSSVLIKNGRVFLKRSASL